MHSKSTKASEGHQGQAGSPAIQMHVIIGCWLDWRLNALEVVPFDLDAHSIGEGVRQGGRRRSQGWAHLSLRPQLQQFISTSGSLLDSRKQPSFFALSHLFGFAKSGVFTGSFSPFLGFMEKGDSKPELNVPQKAGSQ